MRSLVVAVALWGVCLGAKAQANSEPLTWEQVAAHVRSLGPSVLIARAEARAAEALVPVAAAQANPELSYLGYARARGSNTAINGTQHQVQIDQPLYVFGQRGARERHARQVAHTLQLRGEAVLHDALRTARHAFVELLAAQETSRALELAEQRLSAVQHIVSERAAAGAQSKYDVLRVDVELAQLATEARRARMNERAASVALAVELGRPGSLPQAAATLDLPQESAPKPWEKVAEELPALRALGGEVRTAQALVDLAHVERRPVPSLTAGGYWTTDGNSSSVVFGVSMPLPVWNTGRTAIDAAGVGLRVRELARDQLSAQARARYEGALQVLEASRATYEAYERGATEKLPRLRDMAEAAYKGGAANVLVLVDASRSATELDLGRIVVLSEVLHAETEALAAAGAL